MISATISWHVLALQLCTDSSTDCESENMRMLDAGTGNPVRSTASRLLASTHTWKLGWLYGGSSGSDSIMVWR